MKTFSSLKMSLAALAFCGIISMKAQEKKQLLPEGDQIVFGKVYTKEELKKTMGVIRCASTEYEQMLQKQDPTRMTDDQFEAWIAPLIANNSNSPTAKSASGGVVTIPVVVHVLHSGQPIGTAPNISDAQVQSQITVMTQDFRKMAGTPGYNINPVGADTMVQFALAKVDPNGNPTNGIDRVNLDRDMWGTDSGTINSIAKPATIWDPTQYMNMWSLRFFDTGLLGFAQFPTISTIPGMPTGAQNANTDGVVAGFNYFGSSSLGTGFALSAPYDKGRTMTHEVGHFLGLRHIWGDANCGTDYVADTPTHQTSNGGCPTHPKANSCGTADEMFENYMDYTSDGCMNIVTQGQSARIAAVLQNAPRRNFAASTKDQAIPLFANDGSIKLAYPRQLCTEGFEVTLFNAGTSNLTSANISYTVAGGAAQTITWNGNLAPNAEQTFLVQLPSTQPSGAISATLTSVNGGADQRATNNTATGTYTATALPTNYNFTQVKLTLQRDLYGSETRWTLRNSNNQIVQSGGPYTDVTSTPAVLPAVQTFTWNLAAGQCYTFEIHDGFGDGLYQAGNAPNNGYYTLSDATGATIIKTNTTWSSPFEQTKFRIQATMGTSEVNANAGFSVSPNPAGDVLNLSKASQKSTYMVYNTVGQIVLEGKVKDQQVTVSKLKPGNYIITVKDGDVSNTAKFIKK